MGPLVILAAAEGQLTSLTNILASLDNFVDRQKMNTLNRDKQIRVDVIQAQYVTQALACLLLHYVGSSSLLGTSSFQCHVFRGHLYFGDSCDCRHSQGKSSFGVDPIFEAFLLSGVVFIFVVDFYLNFGVIVIIFGSFFISEKIVNFIIQRGAAAPFLLYQFSTNQRPRNDL